MDGTRQPPPPPDPAAAQARAALARGWAEGLAPGLKLLAEAAAQLAASAQPAPELRLRRQRAARELASARETLGGLLARVFAPDAGDSEALPLLQFVEDESGDREILASRLALALGEAAGAEGLRLQQHLRALADPLHAEAPAALARQIVERWQRADLALAHWRTLQALLHSHFGRLYAQAVRDGLAVLDGQAAPGGSPVADRPGPLRDAATGLPPAPPDAGPRLLDRLHALAAGEAGPPSLLPASPALAAAIAEAQREPLLPVGEAWTVPGEALFDRLHDRTLALKAVTDRPSQRATIEIVALMFQSLLGEERLPAALRLGLARLQLPVLRVALDEPEVFGQASHPARRLIDRLGACALGFEPSPPAADAALGTELERLVHLVEAYPDSGRRVFETALAEFEAFVAGPFQQAGGGPGPQALPLAQRMEEREARVVQATVVLRELLAGELPPPRLRDFLFHVWAEVLATTALQTGDLDSPACLRLRAAAGELLWLSQAKHDRAERAEALRRLPPLMLDLREGMRQAGLAPHQQDEHLRSLQALLHEAFSARGTDEDLAARLAGLGRRLDALEGLSPDAGRMAEDAVLAIEQAEGAGPPLHLVRSGGLPPSTPTLARAAELAVGSWFRWQPGAGRSELLQLAWMGRRKRLALLLGRDGRAWLFPLTRLAAHLQAGSLEPAETEAWSARALRETLARLDAEPQRLR